MQDSDPRETALARPRIKCTSKLQTRPLVREGALHQETHKCQIEKKNLVISSRQEPTDRWSQINFNFNVQNCDSYINTILASQTYRPNLKISGAEVLASFNTLKPDLLLLLI
jgi:hypothetical protein